MLFRYRTCLNVWSFKIAVFCTTHTGHSKEIFITWKANSKLNRRKIKYLVSSFLNISKSRLKVWQDQLKSYFVIIFSLTFLKSVYETGFLLSVREFLPTDTSNLIMLCFYLNRPHLNNWSNQCHKCWV